MTREKAMQEITRAVEGYMLAQDYLGLERLFARLVSRSFDSAVMDMIVMECAVADEADVIHAGEYAAHVRAMSEVSLR